MRISWITLSCASAKPLNSSENDRNKNIRHCFPRSEAAAGLTVRLLRMVTTSLYLKEGRVVLRYGRSRLKALRIVTCAPRAWFSSHGRGPRPKSRQHYRQFDAP